MQDVIIRHRHETRRRNLKVEEVICLTPNMRRIILGGEDLDGFVSLGADDHIKLFFDEHKDGKTNMRDYTPRGYDPEARRLTLDFALHEAGPATHWALNAEIGDDLQIGGPRGSAVVAPIFDWYLLIGDETALPAMGRWVEEAQADQKLITLGLITGSAEEQVFKTAATHDAIWAYRDATCAADPIAVLPAVEALALPSGKGFIWIAAEAGVARAIRDHFLNTRAHPPHHLKAAGYWLKGKADGSDKQLE